MKQAIKVGVCILVFFLALLGFSFILNRGNTSMTAEMAEATYPTAAFLYGEQLLNPMEGYASRRDTSYMRPPVTPLQPGRKLTFCINTYGREISGIGYEVRNISGDRLVEKTELTSFREEDDKITVEFSIKDLIEENSEYSMVMILTMEDGKEIYYYSRIMSAESYYPWEKINFAREFSDKTFENEETAQAISMYLESDSTGDNTNYQYVNIHSSFDMITWGDLPVEKESEVAISLEELAETTATLRVEYLASLPDGKETDYFNVTEFYRLRKGTERMYLLDFEREMNQIFMESNRSFYGDKIMLGITDADISIKESEGGNHFAFIKEGALYACNIVNNSCARVFSFYDEKNWDARTRNKKHGIKILNMDETGNITFLVYGYMSRGSHEGELGLLVYAYDGVKNTLEESVFIPYDKSYELLRNNVQRLAYLNGENELFLFLEGTIFGISLAEGSYRPVAEGLTEQTLKVSGGDTRIVWQNGEDPYDAKEMILFDLDSKQVTEIKAESNERIMPLGFMGEDLIYGIARKEDIRIHPSGEVTFPMYVVNIRDERGEIIKSYSQEDLYVTGCTMEENLITLQRVKRVGEQFDDATPDSIMNNQTVAGSKNRVEVVATENLKKIVQIAMRGEMKDKTIKYMAPQEVLYEGGRTVAPEVFSERDNYYVYSKGDVIGVYSGPSPAIRLAYETAGVVVNDAGEYVWIKGNTATKNQIMKIAGTKVGEENTTLAVCLETILNYEGFSTDVQTYLDSGETAMEILDRMLPHKRILDLTGCNLESMLYYLDKDIPVLASSDDGNAVLLVGYNELNTVWMNPKTGTVYKVGMKDSTKYFEENGNNFITYIDEKKN